MKFSSLPDDIVLSVFRSWLGPSDVLMKVLSTLDVAFCAHTTARVEFLRFLSHPCFSIRTENASSCQDMLGYLLWLNSRRLPVTSISIGHHAQLDALESPLAETLVLDHVEDLTVICDECHPMPSKGLQQLLTSCPNATSCLIEGYELDGATSLLCLLLPHLRRLRLLDHSLCEQTVDAMLQGLREGTVLSLLGRIRMQLQELHIHHIINEDTFKQIAHLCPHLRTLGINLPNINRKTVPFFAALTALEELELQNDLLADLEWDDEMTAIGDILASIGRKLKVFRLCSDRRAPKSAQDMFGYILQHHCWLEKIHVQECHWSNGHVFVASNPILLYYHFWSKAMVSVPQERITSFAVDTTGCPTFMDPLINFARACGVKLIELHLSDNLVATILLMLSGCPNVRKCTIVPMDMVSDQDLLIIAKYCKQLETLTVTNGSMLTDVGVRSLFQTCRHIHDLKLAFVPAVTHLLLQEIIHQRIRLTGLILLEASFSNEDVRAYRLNAVEYGLPFHHLSF